MAPLTSLIHVGKIDARYLFLRQISPQEFSWFQYEGNGKELPLNISAPNIQQALRLGAKQEGFRNLHCGFRYTLPERDEHGMNALFYQMMASYNSPNGIYFDNELGSNCIVHFASLESRNLMNQLKNEAK